MLRRRQRTRKKPSRGKENKENTSPEVGGLEPQGQSTPVSSTLESLCGLGELDLPLAFNSIVHNSPITTAATTKNNRKRTHSPTPIRELSTDMPLRPHRLEAAYDLPIPPIRKRRPRPKQTKAKKHQAELEQWCQKMNAEFAELEKIPLNIEVVKDTDT